MGTVGSQFMHFGSPWFLVAPVVVALALALGFITPAAAALCVILELTI